MTSVLFEANIATYSEYFDRLYWTMVLLFRGPLDLLDDLGLSLWTPWLVYVHVREVTSWDTRVLGVLLLDCFVD